MVRNLYGGKRFRVLTLVLTPAYQVLEPKMGITVVTGNR